MLDFKKAEFLGVKSFFDRFSQHFNFDESEFYDMWCTIGEQHFKKYLSGQVVYEQQKIDRVQEIFELVNITLSDSEAQDKFQVYLTAFEESWTVYDDVIPFLEHLKGRRLGIISNGDKDQQNFKLKKMGIHQYFEVIVTAGEVGVSKPDAGIFLIACERAGEKPGNCIYIGNNLYTDILSCEKVGMRGIWLNREGISPKDPYDGEVIATFHECLI